MTHDQRRNRYTEILSTVFNFVVLNLLWLVCSLPLITLPAATAGLFTVMVRWVRGKHVEPLTMFFAGARRRWRASLVVMLINLLVGSTSIANLLILREIGLTQLPAMLSLGATITLTGMVMITNIYIWPLMVLVDYPILSLIKNAAKLALAHLGWSLLALALTLTPLALSLIVPQGVFVVATFSATSMIASWSAWRVLRRYLTPEDDLIHLP